MVNIIHIVDTLCIGGREKLVVGCCNVLAKAGYSVTVVSLVNDNNPLASLLSPEVRFVALPFPEKSIVGLSFFRSALSLKTSLGSLLSQLNPAVIHTHSYLHRLFIVHWAIKTSCGTAKLFHTVHTDGMYYASHDLMSRMKRKVEKAAFRMHKPYLIGISPTVQNNNERYYGRVILESRFIPNGISLSPFDKKEQQVSSASFPGISANDMVLIYVARMVKGKNHILLIRVFARLCAKRANLKLLLVGGGVLQEKIKSLVDELHLQDHVLFSGEVKDIRPFLRIAHIGVFPSAYEGLSMAFIEKMWWGLPLVASSIPVFRYLVQDGKNGFLFDLDKEGEFEGKLILLIEDEKLRQDLGREAKKKALEFDIEKLNKRMVDYYGI